MIAAQMRRSLALSARMEAYARGVEVKREKVGSMLVAAGDTADKEEAATKVRGCCTQPGLPVCVCVCVCVLCGGGCSLCMVAEVVVVEVVVVKLMSHMRCAFSVPPHASMSLDRSAGLSVLRP